MIIYIEVIAANKTQGISKAGKPYDFLDVAYKQDGQVKGKKVMSFGDSKNIFDKLKVSKLGDKFEIVQEKEGDYWQWKTISTATADNAGSATQSATPVSQSAAKTATTGNWETREERAYKQVLIVKQSSLAQAVATLKTDKVSPDPSNVVNLAQTYTDWILKAPETPQSAAQVLPKADFSDMDDDINF